MAAFRFLAGCRCCCICRMIWRGSSDSPFTIKAMHLFAGADPPLPRYGRLSWAMNHLRRWADGSLGPAWLHLFGSDRPIEPMPTAPDPLALRRSRAYQSLSGASWRALCLATQLLFRFAVQRHVIYSLHCDNGSQPAPNFATLRVLIKPHKPTVCNFVACRPSNISNLMSTPCRDLAATHFRPA